MNSSPHVGSRLKMKNKVVLDASALLALIQNEKGAEIVSPLLNKAVISTVNLAEVLTTLKRVVDIPPGESSMSISDIVQEIIPFDMDQAQRVAELYPYVKQKGLSLGDRACLALGQQLQIPIYTADKIWSELQIENVEINIIR